MKSKKYILTLIALTSATALFAANPADLNGDKNISLEEFQTLKKKQAAKNGNTYNEKQINELFEDKDRDGNGVLSYKEFGAHPVDLDDDKSISYEEFAAMHKKRAERAGRTVNEEWVKSTFPKKDTDGDGKLSYEELAAPLK
jgi:Ca2+-binding EF-hand superfamily protein